MKKNSIAIAWIISAYQKPEQVIHIINRIKGPNDTVLLHYDRKSPVIEFLKICSHFAGDSSVICFREYEVFWGGIEIVEVDLFLGKKLIESGIHFDYVIHFTGSTYPIKPDSDLREYLADNYGKTFLDLNPQHGIGSADDKAEFFALSHFGIMPCRSNPKYESFKKLTFKANLLALRLLKKFGFIKTKYLLPNAFPEIYRGYVQTIIHRNHYFGALGDIRAWKFLKQLKYSFAADEVFFNTVIMNTAPRKDVVTDNNLLFTKWEKASSPKNLAYSDFGDMFGSGKFFARKFESVGVLDAIDIAIENKSNHHEQS